MPVYTSDPLLDPRWVAFINTHSHASIFHTPEWLDSLQRTYGYRPVIYTTSPPSEELKNGLVVCRVQSWITGRRLISVPFADHCEPLCDNPEELRILLSHLRAQVDRNNWDYIELRPVNGQFSGMEQPTGFAAAKAFYFHRLDLRPSLQEIYDSLDKDSVRRRIRRAESAGLIYACGRSEGLLKDFYKLLVLTRRRHHLPPQPFAWFRNIAECMGDALSIRLAYKNRLPIATVLTLRFRNTVYYKYAGSDTKYHKLAAMQALLWKTIQESKAMGCQEIDLGRSDCESDGLIAFKDHWTKARSRLVYSRYPRMNRHYGGGRWRQKFIAQAFSCMPNHLLIIAGRLMYRHIG